MFYLALLLSYLAKLLAIVIPFFKLGSGTTLAGLWIETKWPQLVTILTKDVENVILITGTNGKTTTRSIIVKIFEDQNISVCTNRGGANIYRGIASTLLSNWDWRGVMKSKILILEVEEATLPILTKYLKTDYLVLTNIFRDQLDAYGEIDKTLEYFRIAINQSQPKIIINANDQKLLSVLNGLATVNNPIKVKRLEGSTQPEIETQKIIVSGFGITDSKLVMLDYEESSQKYSIDFDSMSSAYLVKNNSLQAKLYIDYKDSNKSEKLELSTNLLGTYNIYNILAAITLTYNFFGDKVLHSIAKVQPVFGRGEKIIYRNKEIWLFLVKNPAGMNQVLDLVDHHFLGQKLNFSFLINDKIADGKDVSWLWDCNFENFVSSHSKSKFYTSGARGLDILLRLQMANANVSIDNNYTEIQNHLDKLIYKLNIEPEKHIVLATYTSMMEFRRLLAKRVELPKINDEGN
jgi:lipid II isoglutaminyl synthase (glutamine-hydrolysing)